MPLTDLLEAQQVFLEHPLPARPSIAHKHADALVTQTSKADIPNEAVGIKVIKKTLQATIKISTTSISLMKRTGDTCISESSPAIFYCGRNELLEFTLVNSELYFQAAEEF